MPDTEAFAKLVSDLYLWADAADEGERISYAYANGAPCPDVISQMGADVRRAADLLVSLYEALGVLLPEDWRDGVMDHMPGVAKARAALSKAEGR